MGKVVKIDKAAEEAKAANDKAAMEALTEASNSMRGFTFKQECILAFGPAILGVVTASIGFAAAIVGQKAAITNNATNMAMINYNMQQMNNNNNVGGKLV